jgi:signal peptidase I
MTNHMNEHQTFVDAGGFAVQGAAPARPKRRWFTAAAIAAAVMVIPAWLVFRMIIWDHYVMPSASMEPTVRPGDTLYVWKAVYGLRVPFSQKWLFHWGKPKRGDFVLLESPEDGTILAKRVGGIPGDRVVVRKGHITINGEEMPIANGQEDLDGRSHPVSLAYEGGRDYEIQLPDDRYFVIGDARGNSKDSRVFGPVPLDSIIGRVSSILHTDGRTE